ncbi:expressed protein [Phakopsora pachyrhizi]|uniref:Expressed protein n=1 Tax=Phakopsora pachyrhizi TaxID=170000 RepID=A0AAV0BB90_PHAPC|nr:expressed protein [Phakopsora pachyrhizi]
MVSLSQAPVQYQYQHQMSSVQLYPTGCTSPHPFHSADRPTSSRNLINHSNGFLVSSPNPHLIQSDLNSQVSRPVVRVQTDPKTIKPSAARQQFYSSQYRNPENSFRSLNEGSNQSNVIDLVSPPPKATQTWERRQ